MSGSYDRAPADHVTSLPSPKAASASSGEVGTTTATSARATAADSPAVAACVRENKCRTLRGRDRRLSQGGDHGRWCEAVGAPAMRSSGGSSKRTPGASTCWACTSVTGSACTGRLRSEAVHLERARGGRGGRRAVRARVARAAGDGRDPRASRTPARSGASGATACPGHDEALLDETSLNYIAPMAQAARRLRPADRRPARGVPHRRRRAVRRLRRRPARGPGPLHPADVRAPARRRVAARGARRSTSGCADPPAASPTSRAGSAARARDRPRVPEGARSTASTSTRRRSPRAQAAPAPAAAWRIGSRSSTRRRRSRRCRGRYDLVTIFEALHDMSYPVEVLRALRGLLAEGGSLIVGDERTAERSRSTRATIERLYYGFSVLHCLPVGMVGENAAGTGTVMRATPSRLRRARPGSPASRCCRSRTTSGASTACPASRRGERLPAVLPADDGQPVTGLEAGLVQLEAAEERGGRERASSRKRIRGLESQGSARRSGPRRRPALRRSPRAPAGLRARDATERARACRRARRAGRPGETGGDPPKSTPRRSSSRKRSPPTRPARRAARSRRRRHRGRARRRGRPLRSIPSRARPRKCHARSGRRRESLPARAAACASATR